MAVMTYREALNLALREEMKRDPRVFVIGEEVGLYEGAYKVTQGLLKEFGPKRVVDTPIAESGFTGVGIGAAMVGLRPVVEMMTFNFALLALDQIVNSAAKMHYMSGGQYNVPIVIRGPGGPAHQLAAQHSQSMEVYFYHVPGLKVVRPSTPMDAKGLLKSAIRDDNPVIFIESETLYNVKGEVPEDPEFMTPLALAQRDHELGIVRHLALHVVERLGLDEDHRVVVADRSFQQALGVHRRGGADDFEPRHVVEVHLHRLRVLRGELVRGAAGTADDERHVVLAARHVVELRRRVDDLVQGQQREVERHHLDHRPQPHHGRADAEMMTFNFALLALDQIVNS